MHDFNNKKCVYIDKLEHTVNKYNNTYHRTIKMKPVNVKPSNGNNRWIDKNYDTNE